MLTNNEVENTKNAIDDSRNISSYSVIVWKELLSVTDVSSSCRVDNLSESYRQSQVNRVCQSMVL